MPDDVGRVALALRDAVIPGLTRDPANKSARCKRTISYVTQAETLHPHGQALRPPGYFDGRPTAGERRGRQCSARFPRETLERMRALRRVWAGGQGW